MRAIAYRVDRIGPEFGTGAGSAAPKENLAEKSTEPHLMLVLCFTVTELRHLRRNLSGLFQPASFPVSFDRARVQRHAAELEGGAAFRAQRLEEISQPFKQRVQFGQLVEII